MNTDFSAITWDADGSEIEQESFRRIDAEVSPEQRARFTSGEWRVARRLVHASADFSLLEVLEFTPGAVEAGLAAMRRGAVIYCDSNMIKSGLSVPKLQRLHPGYSREALLCPIMDPEIAADARAAHTTRALAAVRRCRERLEGAIFLCGNAPLALAGLIRLGVESGVRPALIIGMPVGFVNVIESKTLLDTVSAPWIRLRGRRGGSPLAVAALHGILESA